MSLLSYTRALEPTPVEIDRAVRLTYVQMMLTAIFGASTGGMFLIGFALDLGATDFLLGLMVTIPMFFVVFQLLAAWFIERGLSPKRLTVWFGFITPLCWLLIATLPFFADDLSPIQRLAILVAVLVLVTIASQFSGNARAVWVGDLIPAQRRGAFFGACALFSGIVGTFFAIGEGRFLDFVRAKGLLAFTSLFLFGAIFGLIAAALNIPQVEGKRLPPESKPSFPEWVRTTWQNRPLLILAGVHAIFALGSIVGPFMSAYCLRDLKMSFFGVGCVNAVGTVSTLIFAPMWGKAVDRYGGRPVLNFSLWALAPCGLIWFFIPPGRGDLAYRWMPWVNVFAGFAVSALNVSIASLMYKMTPSKGRSFQFAFYNIFVMLVAAPMPLLGGWLVSTLQSRGWAIDLRVTFYLWIVFIFVAAVCARWIREPDSSSTQKIVFEYLPERLYMTPGLIWSGLAASLSFLKIRVPVLTNPPDPPDHSKDST